MTVHLLHILLARPHSTRKPRNGRFGAESSNMKPHITGAIAWTGGLILTTALAAGCTTATERGKEIASSATRIGSSAASAAGSAASAAGSAASSAASAASSAVSSALDGDPTTIDAPGIGAVTLDGPVAATYRKAGGAAGLGVPTAAPEKISGPQGGPEGGPEGTVYAFTGGTIFESPSHGPKLVRGDILRVYTSRGGPTGPLGWPISDETQTAGGPRVAGGGWIAEFENGTISWLNDGTGSFTEKVDLK